MRKDWFESQLDKDHDRLRATRADGGKLYIISVGNPYEGGACAISRAEAIAFRDWLNDMLEKDNG